MAFLTNNQLSQPFDDFYQTDLLGLRSWNLNVLKSMGYHTRAPGTIRVLPSQPNLNAYPLGSAGLGGNQNVTFNIPDPLDGPNGDWYDHDDPGGGGGEPSDVVIDNKNNPPLNIQEKTPNNFEARLYTDAASWDNYSQSFCTLLGGTWDTSGPSNFCYWGQEGDGGVSQSCYNLGYNCPDLYQADVEMTGRISSVSWDSGNNEWKYQITRQKVSTGSNNWTDMAGPIEAENVRNRNSQFAPEFIIPAQTRVSYRPPGNVLDDDTIGTSEGTFNYSGAPVTTIVKITGNAGVGGEAWRWTYTFTAVDPEDHGSGSVDWPTVTSDPASGSTHYPPITGRCYNLMEQNNSSGSKKVNNHQAPPEASLTVSAVEDDTVVALTIYKDGDDWFGYFSHPNKVVTTCA